MNKEDVTEMHFYTFTVAKDTGGRWEKIENDWQTRCTNVSWEHVEHMNTLIGKGNELKMEGFDSQWDGDFLKARGVTASYLQNRLAKNEDTKESCYIESMLLFSMVDLKWSFVNKWTFLSRTKGTGEAPVS